MKRVKLGGLVSRSMVGLSSMNYLKKRSWECARYTVCTWKPYLRVVMNKPLEVEGNRIRACSDLIG